MLESKRQEQAESKS